MSTGRLQILFVAETAGFDGPERQILHHVRRIDPKRRRARMLSVREPGELSLKLQHAECQVFSGGVAIDSRAESWIERFAAAHRLAKLLRASTPDVVHAFDIASDVRIRKPARMAGVPVIIGAYREHRSADDPMTAASRKSIRLVDALVAPTPELKDEAVRTLGIAPEKVYVVPPAVDLTELRGMTRADDLAEPKLRIGALMRVDEAKGIDVLLDAAEALRSRKPELEWVIAGAGIDAMRWLHETRRRGLDGVVRLAGTRNDRGSFFAGIDVFVAPARRDGLSAALLEAAAAGVPCVAARNPSVEAAFKDGEDALLTAAGDGRALAEATEKLLDDCATAARIGAAARTRISRAYAVENAVVTLHDLHESLAAAAAAR